MAKYWKTAVRVVAYAFIYIFFMLLCQIVFGLTLGGAGREMTEAIVSGRYGDPAALAEAADAATQAINVYVQRNSGLILSISALLSLLVFMKIYSARKLNLFAALRMDRPPSGTDMRYGAFAGASANFAISLVAAVFQSMGLFSDAFMQHEAQMQMTYGTGGILATLLGVGIVVPIVEEIMFRGMVTSDLRRIMPWKAAVLTQGALFGLYHFIPVQICYTIPLGIYLGYITYKTGSVWPAIAGHAAMNATAILLTGPGMEDAITQPLFSMLFMIASVYMLISALRYFVKKEPVPDDTA